MGCGRRESRSRRVSEPSARQDGSRRKPRPTHLRRMLVLMMKSLTVSRKKRSGLPLSGPSTASLSSTPPICSSSSSNPPSSSAVVAARNAMADDVAIICRHAAQQRLRIARSSGGRAVRSAEMRLRERKIVCATAFELRLFLAQLQEETGGKPGQDWAVSADERERHTSASRSTAGAGTSGRRG